MAEKQNCGPYVLSIVWQCKWRSRSRMIVEIQKFCYHGNVTSHFSSLFPTSKNSLLQNEAKCKPFLVKMSFICIRIKNQFHINGFALSSAFKLRLGALRKMVCPYFMSQKQRAVKRRKTKKVWSNLVCKKPPVHLKKDNTSLYKSWGKRGMSGTTPLMWSSCIARCPPCVQSKWCLS